MSQLKWSRVWTAAALAAPLALVPAIALARAGGGQNYGGSGGGGGFGGDGDGLWSLLPLLFLGHGTGFGGLVAFLVVLYVFKQLRRGASSGLGGGLGAILDCGAPPAPGMPVGQVLDVPVHHFNQDAASDGIAAIKAKDTNFDERAFLDRAQTSFFKVQQAWAARNQDLARECMSDALYERHKMQTDQLIANHQTDVLENIVIGNAHIMSASAGAAFDSITVAFTASMTDYTVDESTRKVVDGDQSRQTFTEFWTFIRRGDQKSTAGQTTLSPTCSSCGAPLKLTQGRCDYCGAFARTSSTDWVVDTIEQP